MSDLKAVALELLEKYIGGEVYASPEQQAAVDAEIAEYRARIEAAEPEPIAATTEPAP